MESRQGGLEEPWEERNFFCFLFWPHHAACGILVPQPGIEPESPALEVRSLNQWTTREVRNILKTHKSHSCAGQPDTMLNPCHVTTALTKGWAPGRERPSQFPLCEEQPQGFQDP